MASYGEHEARFNNSKPDKWLKSGKLALRKDERIMVKATLKLSNGTSVVIEGTPEEVRRLLSLFGGDSPQSTTETRHPARKKAPAVKEEAGDQPELADIVNLIKTCDEAESIEEQIRDRASQVNRILLPLYVVHEYLGNAVGLTSGEINKITTDLGIPVSQPNASKALSGTALRYVIGDSVRKKGRPVRYKLHRRGVQYLKSVIADGQNEDQK